ncbi:hypothetical protein [Moorena sp. SIO3B2]|uniref:hypothetical protein n=1 Tax=Moorena sp. SIO3B2 TaxID=2607827 RepID=UPI0013C5FAF5|nr:hypothetical protein [Moorena sp. SIO3B2]NEP32771.1 hypothetical protein [Moorena sp. SIO3B2]
MPIPPRCPFHPPGQPKLLLNCSLFPIPDSRFPTPHPIENCCNSVSIVPHFMVGSVGKKLLCRPNQRALGKDLEPFKGDN